MYNYKWTQIVLNKNCCTKLVKIWSKEHTSRHTLFLAARNTPSHIITNHNISTDIQSKYLLKILFIY